MRTASLVCHCLLLEREDGLVLIDTGLGTADLAQPRRRLGPLWLLYSRPLRDPGQTAIAHVRRLGFTAADVRHIVLTHLDLDHAGGLSDFPTAQVHVLDVEHAAATQPPTTKENHRYRRQQWEHQPHWVIHGGRGEQWMGCEAITAIDDVLFVPLHGHTRGHAGVAVRVGEEWLLHCGDAYYFHGETEPMPTSPSGLRTFQRLVAVDDDARRHNQARLRELRLSHGSEVRLFCAHDPAELSRAIEVRGCGLVPARGTACALAVSGSPEFGTPGASKVPCAGPVSPRCCRHRSGDTRTQRRVAPISRKTNAFP